MYKMGYVSRRHLCPTLKYISALPKAGRTGAHFAPLFLVLSMCLRLSMQIALVPSLVTRATAGRAHSKLQLPPVFALLLHMLLCIGTEPWNSPYTDVPNAVSAV